jgi:hypothetical protein
MTQEPRIVIDFAGHADHFRPRETLVGQYWVEHARPADLVAVEISVLWRTLGKGDEDFGVWLFKRFSASEGDYLDPTQPARFNTQLPLSPLSYDGIVVKIRWCVRVRVFLAGGKELMRDRVFYLGDVRSPRVDATQDAPQLLAY